VKAFGGDISFSSVPAPDPSHGSNFKFTFKLGPGAEEPQPDSSLDKEHFQANYEGLVYEWEPKNKERKISAFKKSQFFKSSA